MVLNLQIPCSKQTMKDINTNKIFKKFDWNKDQWSAFYKELVLAKSKMRNDTLNNYEYGVLLTHQYLIFGNYSEISRRTKIPRTSISYAVRETLKHFSNK